MSNSWEKVRSFLDTMDTQDLRSTLPSSFSSFSSSSNSNCGLHSSSIGTRRWQVCEMTAEQILTVIQPDAHSENRRKEIIEYLESLIEDAFGIKVFPFGSVPLKTYLPHGDIDLTAVCHSNTDEDLAAEICSLLENEEKNSTCIQVKDVLCVPAQVKVVKCTVGGICVDISVNQTAGLAALYFLDQVDQFIGKDHLFKRSVVLIKAWCYYESRLLGGFHGLISTYALETMVLHVINLFHPSLHSPLAVLHKFLDYYSSFDWNSYCIGFNGLVLISSLPEIVVQLPHDCDHLLLTDAFLRSSREPILSSMAIAETKNPAFPVKFLNILDPLREDNNLGRSVSKGNFYRIRSALSYAAQKLGGILMLPLENIKTGLEKFFKDTLELNGKGRRADVVVPVAVYGAEITTGNRGSDHLLSRINYGLWFHDYGMMSPVVPQTSANQLVWNNQWVDMNQNLQYDQSMYYSINRSPPSHVDGFNSFPFTCASPVNWKSRGTGTYIPQLEHLLRRNMIVEANDEEHESEKEQESGKKAKMLGFPACTQKDANLSDERGDSDVFNFSIDEFPLLPGAKLIPIKVSQWSSPDPEQVKDTSASLDSLEFDSIKQSSPRSLSPSEAGKQSDSDVSVIVDIVSDPTTTVTMPEDQESSKSEGDVVAFVPEDQESTKNEEKVVALMAEDHESSKNEEQVVAPMLEDHESSMNEEQVVAPMPEDHESSKNEEQVVAPVQPLQLEDDKEFPPLSRPPEPVITLNKKEFPPLRACLKSCKRGKWKKDIK